MGSASIRNDSPGLEAAAPRGASRLGPESLRRSTAPPNFETQDLALEHDLLAAERLLAEARTEGRTAPDDRLHRQHEGHDSLAGWHVRSPAPSHTAAEPSSQGQVASPVAPAVSESSSAVQTIAWTIVAVGVAAFVCGGVLWIWSFAGDRPDLARIGLPLVLGGQAGLIIGLMLQLESLWQSTQQATQSLDVLDDRVAEIKHATALLGTTHSSSSASFYSHFAQGASSQLLLADLKGQLDLLAMKMARERQ
jgi:hypothetical protein